jgi:hypothetical protein
MLAAIRASGALENPAPFVSPLPVSCEVGHLFIISPSDVHRICPLMKLVRVLLFGPRRAQARIESGAEAVPYLV